MAIRGKRKGAYLLGKEKTYGKGYCGICGATKTPPLNPCLVKWWDPDDGWQVGVLCVYCFEDAKVRPPKEGDYAFRAAGRQEETIAMLRDALGNDVDGLIGELADLAG